MVHIRISVCMCTHIDVSIEYVLEYALIVYVRTCWFSLVLKLVSPFKVSLPDAQGIECTYLK